MTYSSQDISFLRDQNQKKPVEHPPKLISEYMNGRRKMPDGSPFPGIYSIHRTPYTIEPLDNMGPFSNVPNTAIMKCVQSGFTSNGAENIIGYYTGARPAKYMYLTGTDALLKKFLSGRFEPLIDSCGFRNLIGAQSLKKHNRSTGDTAEYKEFPGGTGTFGSLQSEAVMRQESIMIMIRDEIDLVDVQMSSGEGNRLKVSDGRLVAYEGRSRTIDYSTPGESGNSLIEIQYNKGDKRKFFVNCPLCGKKQYLDMGTDKTPYGLKGDYVGGKLKIGYYICYHCHDAIFEYQKEKMLAGGIWMPTCEAAIRGFRSYHFPAFYSPMVSWTKMRQEYDEAIEEGDDGMRSFTNLFLALPFRPSGEKPKFESVIEIRSKSYVSGEVPKDILFLTMAGDVQRGMQKYSEYKNEEILELAEKFKKEKDFKKLEGLPRVEAEVCGHGWDFRTASIIYRHFYGHIDDETSGAWSEFTDWIEETGLRFKRKDGYTFDIKRIFIDCGDGMHDQTVISYCSNWPGTYPTKGRTPLKQDKMKLGTIDEMSKLDFIRYKPAATGTNDLILVVVNYYKRHIYNNLKNKPDQQTGEQPPNSHITPDDYPDSYFKGLTAETQDRKGNFYNRAGRRNEPLDLLVLNKCAADHVVDGWIELKRHQMKERYRKAGKPVPSKDQFKKVWNRDSVTAAYEKEIRAKGY